MSLEKNVEFLRHLPKLSAFKGLPGYGRTHSPALRSPLVEINDFGSNPGGLRMFAFVPEHLPRAPALVVVLHGCGQNAAGYDLGAGWSTLAERYGFALLMPEQTASNNANTCFNLFNPEDIARGSGEAGSIRQMIARIAGDHDIDSRRIYVTGQSMGGAGAWNMIAHRPQFFAAAVICCGSISTEDGTGSIDTPLWNFHGDSDKTVPVSVSRDRVARRRKAGGRPLYTEYAGVDHNVWEWAFTEPELVKWFFSQRRG